jgi:hypothetical protein
MKLVQKPIARWMSKLVAKGAGQADRKQSVAGLRELDTEQLRQVSGGSGGSSQLPKGTW